LRHKIAVISRESVIASLPGDGRASQNRRERRSVRQVAFDIACESVVCASLLHDGVSMADNSMTGTFQIPKDLLSEAKRTSKPKSDRLHVEGWRNSWLSRLAEMLVGKD
jgi:hypothetical protein